MKNMLKGTAYSLAAMSTVAITNVNAAINPQTDQGRVVDGVKGNNNLSIGEVIQNIIIFILGFLALIAVVLVIWAGFSIMTAAGDEEKVKKGKTIIIQALIGLFVIFIAWQVVDWIFVAIQGGNTAI